MSDQGCKKAESPEFLATVVKKDCPHCGTTTVSPSPALPSARADVLEKAERLVDDFNLKGCRTIGPYGHSRPEVDALFTFLQEAVLHLRQLQQPQGKKPEELPLGSWVRRSHKGQALTLCCRIAPSGAKNYYGLTAGGHLEHLLPDEPLIPLDPQ